MKESKALLMVIGFSLLLVLGVVLVGEHVAEAKSKKGKIAVEVANFRGDEQDVQYKVYLDKGHKLLGKRTFDFREHEIESDRDSFVLIVSFSTKGVHKNDLLTVCVKEISLGLSKVFDEEIQYKPGKQLHVFIDLSSAVGSTH